MIRARAGAPALWLRWPWCSWRPWHRLGTPNPDGVKRGSRKDPIDLILVSQAQGVGSGVPMWARCPSDPGIGVGAQQCGGGTSGGSGPDILAWATDLVAQCNQVFFLFVL